MSKVNDGDLAEWMGEPRKLRIEEKFLTPEELANWEAERKGAGLPPLEVVNQTYLSLEDAALAEDCAHSLRYDVCWAAGFGWLVYTGKVWRKAADATVIEIVRKRLRKLHQVLLDATQDPKEAQRLTVLLRLSKIRAVTDLCKGLLEKADDAFDANPYLLNCQNGVVDLRTGDKQNHDPADLMTKIALVDYNPDATHPDWDTALEAVPVDVRDWLQVRYGQAITGFAVDDDVIPIQTGGGQNGKSTLVTACVTAAGDYAVYVPEKVLLANHNDHPTELMTLRGARLAVIEETPEGKHLPTKRLKDLVGTGKMTARYMRQDFVSWKPTHTLFVNTNYVPQVSETDHGTWRRLLLVRFPYKFVHPSEPLMAPNEKHGDPGLRGRLERNEADQLEAVLAWLVDGARAWFDMGEQLPTPTQVDVDTLEWRAEADLILAYAQERLDFNNANAAVASKELYEDFREWLEASGRQVWNDQTFASRFGGHELVDRNRVSRKRLNNPTNLSRRMGWTAVQTAVGTKPMCWIGVSFK